MAENQPFRIQALSPILSKDCHLIQIPPSLDSADLEILQIAEKAPLKAHLKLQKLPPTPERLNLECYLYLKQKKSLSFVDKLIEKAYATYPGHLSIQVNYADLCLRLHKENKIPSIFSSFDLSLLFPSKTTFTVSEFRGFMVVMGLYHLKVKDSLKAELYYTLAVKADPLHPSISSLERRLFVKKPFCG